jgi:hypothetical protein
MTSSIAILVARDPIEVVLFQVLLTGPQFLSLFATTKVVYSTRRITFIFREVKLEVMRP